MIDRNVILSLESLIHDDSNRSKQNLLLCAGSAVNTLMVSGYPVLDGQSRSQFTSSSASTTLSLAAIGLHSEETVSHTFPHCAANAEITNFFFFFFLSSAIPYHADDTLPTVPKFFSSVLENHVIKPRDLNLPISQNTWRSSNISPFSIIE